MFAAGMRRTLCSVVIVSAALPAHAGGIAGIGNAQVDEGLFTASWRNSYGEDNDRKNQDHRTRTRLMTDYGFNSWFASGIYLQGDKRENKNLELDSVIWENRFEFTTQDTDGFFSGARLRYTHRDNDKTPSNVHLRLILGTIVDRWEARANPILYHEVGQDARGGIGLDARFQLTYHYVRGHRAGLETFGDMGQLNRLSGFADQNHTLGPVFAGSIAPDLSYEAGYARGLSKTAPDHTLKFFLVRSF